MFELRAWRRLAARLCRIAICAALLGAFFCASLAADESVSSQPNEPPAVLSYDFTPDDIPIEGAPIAPPPSVSADVPPERAASSPIEELLQTDSCKAVALRAFTALLPKSPLSHDLLAVAANANCERLASEIGVVLRPASGKSLELLGRYVRFFLDEAKLTSEVAAFLKSIVTGFGNAGVVVYTRDGLRSSYAVGSLGIPFRETTSDTAGKTQPVRVFSARHGVCIPFSRGERFLVELKGNGQAPVSLWKILPDGAQRKDYPAGVWEREVTIYGDRIKPGPAVPP